MNWTDEQLSEHQRKAAAASFAGALAPLVEKPREGRIKGVAAASERTYNGRRFDSKAEAEYAQQLDFLVRAGAVTSYVCQEELPIVVNNVPICKVVVDFKINNADGTVDYMEIKGFETETYRLKKKLLLACYPGIRYTVVKVGRK